MAKATTITAAFIALLLSAPVPSALAATIHVPGDYPTIQEALDAALPGDTVLVAPGTYFENILMRTGVVLKSLTGLTTINGGLNASVVTFEDVTDASIIGFQITGGSAEYAGGGMNAIRSSGLIRGCTIFDNAAFTVGGGIALDDSDFDIESCNIHSNYTLVGSGAGISVIGSSDVSVDHCFIRGNSVSTAGSSGGGLFLASGTTARITWNIISRNFADAIYGPGGGIYCGAADALIDHNTIVDNGFFVFGLTTPPPGTPPVWPTPTSDPGLGTAIYIDGGAPLVTNNILGTADPDTGPSRGTAVDCTPGSEPTFRFNDTWNNDEFNPEPEYGAGCTDPTGTEGNISEDPMFCNARLIDYSLFNISPCQGTGESGTNMGALGVGCGMTPTEATSWGAVKRHFR